MTWYIKNKLIFIGFYQHPVLIKVSEKNFTNVTTRRARHRVGTFFFLQNLNLQKKREDRESYRFI